MKKTYSTFWALADDNTILYGQTVSCDSTRFCVESMYCGGAQPHMHDPNECGKCPFDKNARCIPVENL